MMNNKVHYGLINKYVIVKLGPRSDGFFIIEGPRTKFLLTEMELNFSLFLWVYDTLQLKEDRNKLLKLNPFQFQLNMYYYYTN